MWAPETKVYKTRVGLIAGATVDFIKYCFDRDCLDGKRHVQHLPLLPLVPLTMIVESMDPARRTAEGGYVL